VGAYDRDYYREGRTGFSFRVPQTVVATLIIVNMAIWVIDSFTPDTFGGKWLSDQLAVHSNVPRISESVGVVDLRDLLSSPERGLAPLQDRLNEKASSVPRVDTLKQPWLWWQLITYAFAHSPRTASHILCNMLALFCFGFDIEAVYGKREFLRFYFLTAFLAAVVWCSINEALGATSVALGASGAIAGIVILYALNFPHRTVLLFFVVPVPTWLFGLIFVGYDIFGAMSIGGKSNVAYSMHLTGAAFAWIYYQRGWRLTGQTDRLVAWLRSWNRPKLRVHRAEPERQSAPLGNLGQEVDRILEKIYREGEASLTDKERRTLEAASRQYQRRSGSGGL
jgi:membrane associated rhomboid family serine protease